MQLSVADIKVEMEQTLQRLVPIATKTAKVHHGFGWVGEWANTGLVKLEHFLSFFNHRFHPTSTSTIVEGTP